MLKGYFVHLAIISSLTCIRERYGMDVFRQVFEAIVEQCQVEHEEYGEGQIRILNNNSQTLE